MPSIITFGASAARGFGFGTSTPFLFTIASNQTNANLRTLAINAGWNQSSTVIATINSGVYVSSNSTGTPALTINGSFPGGVSLINNGLILGMGGNGGNGSSAYLSGAAYTGTAGAGGGLALSVSVATTITNNNIIGGGGGGGGGGRGAASFDPCSGSWYPQIGGGGGGGQSSAAANSAGGVPYADPLFGFNLAPYYGGAGTSGGAGAGGSRSSTMAGVGGSGGSWGAGGATGGSGSGGSQASGPYGGGAGGGAVSGNANITWLATGTRYGSIA
jgi:hypothetical protein